MTIDWTHFTPYSSLIGGVLIGLSAALLVLLNGRVAGISGILAAALRPMRRSEVEAQSRAHERRVEADGSASHAAMSAVVQQPVMFWLRLQMFCDNAVHCSRVTLTSGPVAMKSSTELMTKPASKSESKPVAR